jgi:hypothetical protein
MIQVEMPQKEETKRYSDALRDIMTEFVMAPCQDPKTDKTASFVARLAISAHLFQCFANSLAALADAEKPSQALSDLALGHAKAVVRELEVEAEKMAEDMKGAAIA